MAEIDLTELRASLEGTALGPGDAGYEEARRCFNAHVDRRPAAIARCVSAADVATAFGFAREAGLDVTVRGGGHNPAGHCLADGALTIDLSRMREVTVDPAARTARAQGGATWLDFDAATQAHGLVTPGGVVGTTGVCGLTLGGGIGHLTTQHGLTCDNMVAAELVTPDGETVRADEDLLWGLRGGGGNFGVVTAFEYRLHPVERVVGGRLTYHGPRVRDVLRRFSEIAARGPRDFNCHALLEVDEDVAPVAVVAPCSTGADAEPPELRELRMEAGLVDDGVRPHGFLDQQRVFDPPYGEDRAYWKGHFVTELGDELIDALLERITALGRSPGQILIESLHGAPKDADPALGAVGFRDAAFNITAMGTWRDPSLDDEYIAWSRDTAAAAEPWSVSGGYVNYMQADEPIERVRAAFGAERFARLQALKGRYDPGNVLRRNQNIPPVS